MNKTKRTWLGILAAAFAALVLAASLVLALPVRRANAAETHTVSSAQELIILFATEQAGLAGDTIALKDDITLDLTQASTVTENEPNGHLDIPYSVTFDLKEHTLTVNTENEQCALNILNNASVTVKNGTLAGTSKGNFAQVQNGASVILQEVTVKFDCKAETADTIAAIGGAGSITLDGVQFELTNAAPVYDNASSVTYASLQDEINAGNIDIQLTKDMIGGITIPQGRTVRLDLNGHTLTNAAGEDTITNFGSLTITGSGTVKNEGGSMAAVRNFGTAQLNGGTYTRTVADGAESSYYVIKNFGSMTIGEGTQSAVFVTAGDVFSSMIANGYYNADEKTTYKDMITAQEHCTMVINGGTFEGGMNAVKNDNDGVCTISGGTFTNNYEKGAAVISGCELTITGGTFKQENAAATSNALRNTGNGTAVAIKGGEFFGALYNEGGADGYTVSGGSFDTPFNMSYLTKEVSAYFYQDGSKFTVAAEQPAGTTKSVAYIGGGDFFGTLQEAINAVGDGKTINMSADATQSLDVPTGKSFRLKMNGYTITAEQGKPAMTIEGSVTWVNDVTGEIVGDVVVKAGGAIEVQSMPEVTFNGDLSIEDGAKAVIENGIFQGKIKNSGSITISGGKYKNRPEDAWLAETKGITQADGMYEVATLFATITYTQGGQETTKKFADWSEAMTALKALNVQGEITVKIIREIVDGAAAFEVGEGQTVILDQNGKVFSADIRNSGTLTITGKTGVVKAKAQTIENSGTLTIAGGMFNVSQITNTDSGELTITGGSFGGDPVRETFLNVVRQYLKKGVIVTGAGESYVTVGEKSAAVNVINDGKVIACNRLTVAQSYARYFSGEQETEIVLLQDASVSSLTFTGSAAPWTIDLNGYTLTVTSKFGLTFGSASSDGVFSVANGNIVFKTGETNKYALNFKSGAALTLDGVAVTFTGETPFSGMANVAAGSSLTITGGEYFGAITAAENSSVTITGGKFEEDVTAFLTEDYEQKDGVVSLKNPVAMIGDQAYASLQDAVNAVPANADAPTTIVLVGGNADQTITGNGVIVQSGQNIIIDFDGKTYDINNNTVGSSGTETNGFQLLGGSTVVMQNGVIRSDYAKILLQNYCALTLEDMKLSSTVTGCYIVSNNFGSMTVTGDTEIIADSTKRQVAFDVYFGMSANYYGGIEINFTEDFTGKVEGAIEYGRAASASGVEDWQEKASLSIAADDTAVFDVSFEMETGANEENANINIESGTFKKVFAPAFLAKDTALYMNSDKTSFAVAPANETPAGMQKVVAMIGDQVYDTLQAAIDAAKDNETVTLVANVTEQVTVPQGETLTLDLYGHKLTYNQGKTLVNKGHLTIVSTGDRGTISGATTAVYNGADSGNEELPTQLYDITLSLSNVILTSTGSVGAVTLNNNFAKIVSIDGCEIEASAGMTAISNSGSIEKISDTTIKVEDIATGLFKTNGKAIVLTGHPSTEGSGVVSSVSACDITGDIEVAKSSAGERTGSIVVGSDTTLSEGSEFVCGDGYYVFKNADGNFTAGAEDVVVEAGALAVIGDQAYASLQAAINAAEDDDTVTLLADVVLTETVTIEKDLTLDLGSWTLTAPQNAAALVIEAGDVTIKGAAVQEKSSARAQIVGGAQADRVIVIKTNGTAAIESVSIQLDTTVNKIDEVAVLAAAVEINGAKSVVLNGVAVEMDVFAASGDSSNNVEGILIVNTGEVEIKESVLRVSLTVAESIANAQLQLHGIHAEQTHLTVDTVDITTRCSGRCQDTGIVFYGAMTQDQATAEGASEQYKVLNVINCNIDACIIGISGNGGGTNHGTIMNIVDTKVDYSDRPNGAGVIGTGIYHPQYGILNVSGNDTYIIGGAGIEIRSGELNLAGGTVVGTDPLGHWSGGSGNTVGGAAVAISQHTTELPITVSITGGTLEATGENGRSVYELDTVESDEPSKGVALSLTGGIYNAPVESENLTQFIEGGRFKTLPAAKYCSEDFAPVYSNGYFDVIPSTALKEAKADAQADVRAYAAMLGLDWSDIQAAAADEEHANHDLASAVMTQYNAIASAVSESDVSLARLAVMNALDIYAAFVSVPTEEVLAEAVNELRVYAKVLGLDIAKLLTEEVLEAQLVQMYYEQMQASATAAKVAEAKQLVIAALDAYAERLEEAKTAAVTAIQTAAAATEEGEEPASAEVVVPTSTLFAIQNATTLSEVTLYQENALKEIADIRAFREEIAGQTAALKVLDDALEALDGALLGADGALGTLQSEIKNAIAAAQNAITGAAADGTGGMSLKEVYNALNATIGEIRSDVTQALSKLQSDLTAVKDGMPDDADLEKLLSDIQTKLDTAVTAITGGDGNSIANAVNSIETAFTTLQTTLVGKIEAVKTQADTLLTLFAKDSDGYYTMKELAATLATLATPEDLTSIQTTLTAVTDAQKEIKDAIAGVKTELTAQTDAIDSALTALTGKVDTLTGSLAAVNSGLTEKIDALQASATALSTALSALASKTDVAAVAADLKAVAEQLNAVKASVDSIAVQVSAAAAVEEAKTEGAAEIEAWLNAYLDEILGNETAGLVRASAYTAETTEGELYARLVESFGEDNAGLVLKYYNEALAAIDAAESVSDVTSAVSTFKAQVASVEAAAGNAPSFTVTYILLAAVLVVALVALLVLLLKRSPAPAPAPASEPASTEPAAEETAAAEAPSEAEGDVIVLPELEEDQEHVVIAATTRTFDEAYEALDETARSLFDRVKAYALTKEDAAESMQSSGVCVKRGGKLIVKLTVRRGNPVALFRIENDLVKDFRRNAESPVKLKVRATELVLHEEGDLEAAYAMVDLAVEQIERDIENAKERRREARRARRLQNQAAAQTDERDKTDKED